MKHEKVPKAQKSKKKDEFGYVSFEEGVDGIDKNGKKSEEMKEGEYPVEHCSQQELETPPTMEL
jgi:hypothetical protein